jgi:hypothetical protein
VLVIAADFAEDQSSRALHSLLQRSRIGGDRRGALAMQGHCPIINIFLADPNFIFLGVWVQGGANLLKK